MIILMSGLRYHGLWYHFLDDSLGALRALIERLDVLKVVWATGPELLKLGLQLEVLPVEVSQV